MSGRGVVSIGIGAAVGPEVVARLAPMIEDAGFHGLWVNDIPSADALEVLEAAAGVTTVLTLGAGVLPIDRRTVDAIVADVVSRALPQDRLVLGIGAGGATVGGLDAVRTAAVQLRAALDAKIMVGALGPRMRDLAATQADGPLLSWLTPEVARAQAAEARVAASEAHVALYVRTALSPSAGDRMRAEMKRYGAVPAYAANFARLGITVDETVLDAGAGPIADRLDAYRAAVDEVVLRAITPADTFDDYLTFIGDAEELL